MKTNIKLRVTPEQSEAVQNTCFANGVFWYSGNGSKVKYTNAEYLFIDSDRVWYRPITDHNIGTETEGYTEIDADLFIRTNGTCVESTETLAEECQFAKYGFEKPKFECKILGEIEDVLYGATWTQTNSTPGLETFNWHPEQWDKVDGSAHNDSRNNLIPIKKPWYKTCKFPCIIMADYCMPVVVKHYDDGYVYDFRDNKYCVKAWKLLRNTEIEGLKQ